MNEKIQYELTEQGYSIVNNAFSSNYLQITVKENYKLNRPLILLNISSKKVKFTNINLDQVDSEGKKQFKLVTDRAYIIESSKHMKAIRQVISFLLVFNRKAS